MRRKNPRRPVRGCEMSTLVVGFLHTISRIRLVHFVCTLLWWNEVTHSTMRRNVWVLMYRFCVVQSAGDTVEVQQASDALGVQQTMQKTGRLQLFCVFQNRQLSHVFVVHAQTDVVGAQALH